jgi:hypothetical protein
MLWSSTDDDDTNLDANYGPEDLDDEARERNRRRMCTRRA